MLRPLLITVAIGLVMGSAPAFAYKMSCEEYCRTKICITTNYNYVSAYLHAEVYDLSSRPTGKKRKASVALGWLGLLGLLGPWRTFLRRECLLFTHKADIERPIFL